MATLTEMMNASGGALSQAFQNPWTQLGMQFLNQGGWQQGDPGFGQRFGAAGMGFMQQQAEQQKAKQAEMLLQMQMAEALRKQKEAGKPKMPFQYSMAQPTGDQVQYTFNPATGGYDASQPYRSAQQQGVDVRSAQAQERRQQWETEQQFRERQAKQQASQFDQNQELQQQRFGYEKQRGDIDLQKWQAEQQRKLENDAWKREHPTGQAAATAAWSPKDKVVWQAKRKAATRSVDGAMRMLDRMEQSVNKLIGTEQQGDVPGSLEHPGLSSAFGMTGALTGAMGAFAPQTANARSILDTLKNQSALTELRALKESGASLGQVSNFENQMLQNALAPLQTVQTYEQAKQSLADVRNYVRQTRQSLQGAYQDDYGVEPWNAPAEQPAAQQPQQVAPPTAQDVMTPADIEATMQETGWSREEVIRRAQAKGIKIGG